LTYNTANGRGVIHKLQTTVLSLLKTTNGARGIATNSDRNTSVKVSNWLFFYCLFTSE